MSESPFLRILLMPFAWLYGGISRLRNLLYDRKVFRSVQFDFPIIAVGNLSYGGTGKTPMVEYLIRLLSKRYHVATLSRGYGRKTNGYRLAKQGATAEEVGDEPALLKHKYPQVAVGVGESRVLAIPHLLGDAPKSQVLLLDDAFQHRTIKPGMSILLTSYHKRYTHDLLLPAGTLRESRAGARRADFIIVTKCPPDMSVAEREAIRAELRPGKNQLVLFSYIQYGQPYHVAAPTQKLNWPAVEALYLFSGMGAPEVMEEYVETKVGNVVTRRYRDHHRYDRYDVEAIFSAFKNIEAEKKAMLTTEKDVARLFPFRESFIKQQMPLFVLPVQMAFFEEDKSLFEQEVLGYLQHIEDQKQAYYGEPDGADE